MELLLRLGDSPSHLYLLDQLLLVQQNDFHMEGLDDGPAAHLEALLHAPHPRRSLLIPRRHPRPPPPLPLRSLHRAAPDRPERGSAGDWAGPGNTVRYPQRWRRVEMPSLPLPSPPLPLPSTHPPHTKCFAFEHVVSASSF